MHKFITRPVVAILGALFALVLVAPAAGAGDNPYTNNPSTSVQDNNITKPNANTPAGNNLGRGSQQAGGALAVTGGEAITLAVIGLAFLASGVVIVTVARRRDVPTA